MSLTKSSDLATTTAAVEVPVIAKSVPGDEPIARIDLLHVANGRAFVYGWILGLAKAVERAFIYAGSAVFDIKEATVVPRPDIAEHFSLDSNDQQHGFCAIFDLPQDFVQDYVSLYVALDSGKSSETRWPFSGHGSLKESQIEPYTTALTRTLPLVQRPEARRLAEFAEIIGLSWGTEYLPALPPPVRFSFDLCCVLDDTILVIVGWIFDPAKDLTLAQVQIGGSNFDLLSGAVAVPRQEPYRDATQFRKNDLPLKPGFVLVRPIPPLNEKEREAKFVFASGAETVRFDRPLVSLPQEARKDLAALCSKLEPESAFDVIDCLNHALRDLPGKQSLLKLVELIAHNTVERLPVSIQHPNPRLLLYIDRTILVPNEGILLEGWFNEDQIGSAKIVAHCDSSVFVISDGWVRQTRPDVMAYLASSGIQSADHRPGFTCFVPLQQTNLPFYVTAECESGDVRRMRVVVPEKPMPTLEAVRALLTPLSCEPPELLSLLENHIGPAVSASWAGRPKPVRKPVVRTLGKPAPEPAVSIIVPLYGRHDFAEYQLALFADDKDFHQCELIYVVDDPSIFAEFNGLSEDLYGIYQVPFVIAFPGANLGFAGANNFGAQIARGRKLLLLNSDVMPKRSGWVGDLLRIYQSLATPGLVGVKLLYEDGSVQHAGMAFRKYSGWGNLWINDHPLKGQSPSGLSGTKEVDAVTAACTLIETDLYRKLGGLSEDYIVGDFEDSDLCLRAREAGHRNYVALDIELYHLERQSQDRIGDANWRRNLTLYNCWLHNRRWGTMIQKTAKEVSQSEFGNNPEVLV
jgi:GT2 family glycosyltransferase